MVLFRKKKESAASERLVQLTIIKGNDEIGDGTGKVFNLHCGNNFIGRNPFCEVVLNSGSVSRRHANLKISHDKQSFSIVDLGSFNGVIIKPSTILKNEGQPIKSGDEIQIGEIHLKLVAMDQETVFRTDAMDVKELMKELKKEK